MSAVEWYLWCSIALFVVLALHTILEWVRWPFDDAWYTVQCVLIFSACVSLAIKGATLLRGFQ